MASLVGENATMAPKPMAMANEGEHVVNDASRRTTGASLGVDGSRALRQANGVAGRVERVGASRPRQGVWRWRASLQLPALSLALTENVTA